MVSDISKFEVGDQISPLNIKPVTKKSLKRYADASGDPNLIHLSKDFAQKNGLPDVIAHGMLVMAYLGRMLTNTFPQSGLKSFSSKFISGFPCTRLLNENSSYSEAEDIPEFKFFRLLVTVSASLPIHETIPSPVTTTRLIFTFLQFEKDQLSYPWLHK